MPIDDVFAAALLRHFFALRGADISPSFSSRFISFSSNIMPILSDARCCRCRDDADMRGL